MPGSVPAASRHTHDCAQRRKALMALDTYASNAAVFNAVALLYCLSRKCMYFVYLNICGEVAGRLKAAVC